LIFAASSRKEPSFCTADIEAAAQIGNPAAGRIVPDDTADARVFGEPVAGTDARIVGERRRERRRDGIAMNGERIGRLVAGSVGCLSDEHIVAGRNGHIGELEGAGPVCRCVETERQECHRRIRIGPTLQCNGGGIGRLVARDARIRSRRKVKRGRCRGRGIQHK
jgi:hypothetical protein